jgi:RNA polymerase sigma-B factor
VAPATEDDRALFEEYRRTGDRAVRDRLVEANLGLARHLARRFEGRGEPLDDLSQVAAVALVKAVERYDPERGMEFSTFAVPTILGEIKRHFRDRTWAVRVPRPIKELNVALGNAVSELTQELGRSPTIAEVAARAGATTEAVLEAMDAGRAYRGQPLDTPDSDERPRVEQLGVDDPALGRLLEQAEVRDLLTGLPERERTIVVLRFYGGLTQSQIADRVGVSQMHVSRLLARSLQHLREAARTHSGTER